MIDLRSDTVTRPSQAMRQAMAGAEVGDDVYGDDPSVNQLEQEAAVMSGKSLRCFYLPAHRLTSLRCSATASAGKSILSGRRPITICLRPEAQPFSAVFNHSR